MDVPQLKEHFWNPLLAFLGLSELKPARAPMSCVLRGGRGWGWGVVGRLCYKAWIETSSPFGLKLCQWVPGPWREWYWNSNESPTGGLFTWSYTFRPLNRVFFFFNHYFFFFFLATTVSLWSRLTRTAGIQWLGVSQCWNTPGSGGQWRLSAFVEAALLRLYFSAQTL